MRKNTFALMISLATPFGSEISTAVKGATTKLMGVADKAQNEITHYEGFDEMSEGLGGGGMAPNEPAYDHNDPALHPTDITSDKVTIGDWYYERGGSGWIGGAGPGTDKSKTAYGPLMETINGLPVVSVSFYGLTALTELPVLPLSTTSLIVSNCSALQVVDELPAGIKSVKFNNCTALTTLPEIPSTVTSLAEAFRGCTALTGTLVINANVDPSRVGDYDKAFDGVDFEAQGLYLTGDCPALDKLGSTGRNYISLTPEGVNDSGATIFAANKPETSSNQGNNSDSIKITFSFDATIDLSEGTLKVTFGNRATSGSDAVMTVYLEDSAIYTTDVLAPGEKVSVIALSDDVIAQLETGTYTGQMVVDPYNTETGEQGPVALAINLTIVVQE